MKKTLLDQPTTTDSQPAADVPFFARALGARELDTDRLGLVIGGTTKHERLIKTSAEQKAKL